MAASVGDPRALRRAMVAAFGGILVVTGGTAYFCHSLLRDATAGEPVAATWLFFPLAVLLVTGSLVVAVFQTVHAANRVAGPEQRLMQSMQRIRRGDLAFRVHLRNGDLLAPLARECNELLDWLNRNPPAGATVGSDVVAVGGRDPGDDLAWDCAENTE